MGDKRIVEMTPDELRAEYDLWVGRYNDALLPGHRPDYKPGYCYVRMSFISGVARKRGITLHPERTAS